MFVTLIFVTFAVLVNIVAAGAFSGQDTVYIIRHAEKPTDSENGIDYSGATDVNSLIVKGWQRAGALVAYFDYVLNRPNQVYACQPYEVVTSVGTTSKRMQETLTPMTEKFNIFLNMTYTKGQEKKMAAELDKLSGVTLISWPHGEIPLLANYLKLVDGTKIPDPWDDTRYDIVWRFVRPDPLTPW